MASSDARTPDQIEADMNAIRNRLTGSIEGLIDQVHPNRIKQRAVRRTKTLASDEMANLKAQVIDPQGNVRTTRVAILGGALAGVITLVVVIGKLAQRRSTKPRVGIRR